MKKTVWLTLLLCMLMLASAVLSGCSNGIVVGKVGKENVTTKDVDLFKNFILMQNGMTTADVTTAADMTSLNTSALNSTTMYKMLMQKGTEKKYYPLSATDKSAVDKQVTDYLASMKASFKADFDTKAKTDPSIDSEKASQQAVDDQLKKNNLTVADLTNLLTQIKVAQLLEAEANKDITASDEDAKAKYDELLKTQQDSFTKDAAAYETAMTDGTTVIVYKPAGYRYVKHILIAMPTEIASQISTAQSASDTAKIKTLREDGLKQIQAKADEVLAKVQGGGDFDALMTQYGEDPGMKQAPESTTGYPLGKDSSFVTEFKDAAMKLSKIGDTTGLVATDFGYHIIKWVSDVPSGPVNFDDVKQALKDELLATKKDANWTATTDQWKKEIVIVQNPEKIPVNLPSPAPSPANG